MEIIRNQSFNGRQAIRRVLAGPISLGNMDNLILLHLLLLLVNTGIDVLLPMQALPETPIVVLHQIP
jgi:hypothetical protein